ncbi:MAG: PD-(D/E)XK nuclease family protein [Pseudomonadota bacterium]|nr:PD-(D/E)XK nuclease family protein [Pseudomonadota bacterium]
MNIDTKNIEGSLVAFLADIHSLKRINERFNRFNLFEGLGLIRQEIKHSNALATILDSYSGLNIDDTLFKSFLRFAYDRNEVPENQLCRMDFELADYDDLQVLREYRNIDLLILSRKNNHIFIIENKIGAKESADQLAKYQKIVDEEFKDFKKLFLFLSPDGTLEPSDLDWNIISYEYLLISIEDYLLTKTLGLEQKLFLEHYTQHIKRYIVTDSELVELAKKIYLKHRSALDFIFDNRPDNLSKLKERVESLLSEKTDFTEKFGFDTHTKGITRIYNQDWDDYPFLETGGGAWTKSNRVLLWEVFFNTNSVAIALVVGPSSDLERRNNFRNALQEKIPIPC